MPTRLPSSIKITFPVNNLINANEISKAVGKIMPSLQSLKAFHCHELHFILIKTTKGKNIRIKKINRSYPFHSGFMASLCLSIDFRSFSRTLPGRIAHAKEPYTYLQMGNFLAK